MIEVWRRECLHTSIMQRKIYLLTKPRLDILYKEWLSHCKTVALSSLASLPLLAMEVVYFSGGKRDVSLVQLWELQKPDDVTICVFYRCNQLPPTDIFDLLLCLCASV